MATSSSEELLRQVEAKAEEHMFYPVKPTERPWRPGMLRQLPWTGLLALLLGFGCGVAALTIALISNGKPLDHWDVQNHSVQPTVLLAVLVTIANALLGYAYASGLAVFWWSSALAGSTLRKLHASQSRGDSLMAMLTLRPVFNAVTFASIFTILLLMDQPLFQRGIRVAPQIFEESRNMRIPITSSPLQLGATGVIPSDAQSGYANDEPQLLHPLYAQVLQQYQNRDPIRLALPQCKGRCEFDVISTGWDIDCVERETPYRLMGYWDYQLFLDYIMSANSSESEFEGPPRRQPAFSVNITYHPGYEEGTLFYDQIHNFHIDTSVMYKATPGANGTMRWRNCTLTEALIRYPVEVSNDTLRLKPMPPGTNRTIHKILRGQEYGSDTYATPSTLGGIWRTMNNQFAAQANVTFLLAGQPDNTENTAWTGISTQDIVSNTYLQASANDTIDSIDYSATWSDPTDDMITMAHELTLRAAIATTNTLVVTAWNQPELETTPNLLTQGQPEIGSPNLTFVNRTTNQEVQTTMTFEENVYKTQPQWLAGAFALIVIACLSIMPTYWGWWLLGRPVSMSPLEIAKAFDAPLMQRADPNGSAAEHLRTVGDMRVRYGYHATVVEELESDTTERLSHQTDSDDTLNESNANAGGQDSSNDARPSRPYFQDGRSSDMSVVPSATPEDGIELQPLPPKASPATSTLPNQDTTGSTSLPSDPPEDSPGIQVDPSGARASGTGPAPTRISTRTEMRLKFAEGL